MRLSQFEFPARLSEITRGYFQKCQQLKRVRPPLICRRFSKRLRSDALKTPFGLSGVNATLRTTAVATMLDGGHAGIAAANGRATVNCRLLRTNRRRVAKTLRRVLADDQISITP